MSTRTHSVVGVSCHDRNVADLKDSRRSGPGELVRGRVMRAAGVGGGLAFVSLFGVAVVVGVVPCRAEGWACLGYFMRLDRFHPCPRLSRTVVSNSVSSRRARLDDHSRRYLFDANCAHSRDQHALVAAHLGVRVPMRAAVAVLSCCTHTAPCFWGVSQLLRSPTEQQQPKKTRRRTVG